MAGYSPDLRVVPLNSILLQEGVTDEKGRLLAQNMESRGAIINPVVVAPFDLPSGEQRFLQLDGASRLTALAILGAPWAFVHVVDYRDVTVTTWTHVTEMNSAALRRLDGNRQDVRLFHPEETASDWDLVATALFAGSQELSIYSQGGPVVRAQVGCQLASLYLHRPEERIDLDGKGLGVALTVRASLGPDGVILNYSPFSPDDILKICAAGAILPPGVTRHRLQERVLMEYPLPRLLDSSIGQEQQIKLLRQDLKHIKFHPYHDAVTLQAEPWK